MGKARNIADLLDDNGDVKSASLDNVPASNNASALTTGTLPIARIADGAVTAAKVAADVATQAELDTVSTVASAALPKAGGTMTGALTVNGTYIKFPTGTSNPSSPAVGWIYYNTSVNGLKHYNGSAWDQIGGFVYAAATGGTVTTDGDYKVHSFTSSGTFTVTTAGEVEYLIVAGGGGGGQYGGGGGGAGGLLNSTVSSLSVAAYTITVGAGGSGGSSQTNGANSSALGFTAIGGGQGGNPHTAGSTGGSGGGGSTANAATGGAATSGQGNIGGGGATGGSESGGSGGGAGAAGVTGVANSNGKAGGIGLVNDISGSNVYYAGGGGAGVVGGSYTGGAGGTGGGGHGGAGSGETGKTAGTANTGGGGGGGAYVNGYGAAGGSGIVIIRYKFQ